MVRRIEYRHVGLFTALADDPANVLDEVVDDVSGRGLVAGLRRQWRRRGLRRGDGDEGEDEEDGREDATHGGGWRVAGGGRLAKPQCDTEAQANRIINHERAPISTVSDRETPLDYTRASGISCELNALTFASCLFRFAKVPSHSNGKYGGQSVLTVATGDNLVCPLAEYWPVALTTGTVRVNQTVGLGGTGAPAAGCSVCVAKEAKPSTRTSRSDTSAASAGSWRTEKS
ncbi:Protein of unknown function [Gryllus bimaculatus]|nr:Protein of unknown function [Gryllus bimaculatus]